MKVYPGPGLQIRDPDKQDFLPEAGRDVPDSTYWRRRLRVGDVTLTATEVTATPPAPSAPVDPVTPPKGVTKAVTATADDSATQGAA